MTKPETSRLVETTGIVLLAATAWLSLDPYFTWHSRVDLIVSAFGAAVAAALFVVTGHRPPKGIELAALLAITVFVVYITIQPKTDGGHTRWVGVLPTLWAATLLDDENRRRCLRVFASIFAVSLLPGIFFTLAAAAGVPLTLRPVDHPNPLMGGMLMHWNAVFLGHLNSTLLPWGGVLFRLCGVYDEPGMVGTISALLLAAHSYRLFSWRTLIFYVAGVLSFSLAFALLALAGLMGRALFYRFWSSVAAGIPIALAASLTLGFLPITAPPGVVSRINIEASAGRLQEFTTRVGPQDRILRHKGLSNRVTPQMQLLIEEYLRAGWRIKVFGIASDATATRGGLGQTISRVYLDHGVFGAVLLFVGIGLFCWHAWRRAGFAIPVGLFAGVFLLSMYQRPVVWLPYALLILIGGLALAAQHDPGWSAPLSRLGVRSVGSKPEARAVER